MRRLTEKQLKFIKYKKQGLTNKDAVIKAGYKVNRKNQDLSARVVGSRNLTNINIQKKIVSTTEKALQKLKQEANNNVDDLISLKQQTKDDNLKFKTITDMLDRAGVRVIDKSVKLNLNMDISQIPE